MTNEGEVGEETGALHFGQGGRRVELGDEFEVDDGQLGVGGIGTRIGGHFGQADDGGFAGAVVDKNTVAGPHGADGGEGLGVADAVPGGA